MRNACDLAYVYFIIEPKNALSPNLTLPHYEVGMFVYYIMLCYFILYYVILLRIIFYYITSLYIIGLQMAYQLLSQGSRTHVPRKLIVMISDGWYTQGPNPWDQRNIIMKRVRTKTLRLLICLFFDQKFLLSLSS